MGPSSGAWAKKEISLASVVAVLIITAILVVWFLLPSLGRMPQEHAGRMQCQNNLRQIGKAMQIYASDHRQVWPDVFTEESTAWDDVGNTRTDEWDPVTGKGRPPKAEPGDNGKPIQSNTANLWLLFAETGISPEIFICPETNQEPDVLVTDPKAVRDFRGETFVSYSFQNVLGDYRLMSTSGRASSLAVAADANPMRRDFRTSGIGEKKREGVTDRQLARNPQFLGQEEHIAAWNAETGGVAGAWELNSPNHGFKGQNVLYLDGHVMWTIHPYSGPNWDNIWIARKPEDGWEIDENKIGTLRHFNDPASYNGRFTLPADSTGDSFLVP
jgi:prepilin-type processing-associated H-X9-DG protein